MKATQTCSISDCDRPMRARGWCKHHWQRWSRHGDPLGGGPARVPSTGSCSVVGCDRADKAHGLCPAHYSKWWRCGDPLSGAAPRDPRPADWTPGYSAVHMRLASTRGPAASLTCVDCGNPAAHWSYDYTDPDAPRDKVSGLPYSLDLDRYAPRCVPCHRHFDLRHAD